MDLLDGKFLTKNIKESSIKNMTKDKFIEVLNLIKKQDELTLKACESNVDLIDFCEPINKAISILIEEVATKEGADLIFWFLYDNVKHEITETIKGKKVKIHIKNESDLFAYLSRRDYLKRDTAKINKEYHENENKMKEEFFKVINKINAKK